jgi:hypothetical protein
MNDNWVLLSPAYLSNKIGVTPFNVTRIFLVLMPFSIFIHLLALFFHVFFIPNSFFYKTLALPRRAVPSLAKPRRAVPCLAAPSPASPSQAAPCLALPCLAWPSLALP